MTKERETRPSFPLPLKPKFPVTFSSALEIVAGLKGIFFARVPSPVDAVPPFTAQSEEEEQSSCPVLSRDPTTTVMKRSYGTPCTKYRVFQNELYNFGSLYTFMQRTVQFFELS
jgi:hypothetical protein